MSDRATIQALAKADPEAMKVADFTEFECVMDTRRANNEPPAYTNAPALDQPRLG